MATLEEVMAELRQIKQGLPAFASAAHQLEAKELADERLTAMRKSIRRESKLMLANASSLAPGPPPSPG